MERETAEAATEDASGADTSDRDPDLPLAGDVWEFGDGSDPSCGGEGFTARVECVLEDRGVDAGEEFVVLKVFQSADHGRGSSPSPGAEISHLTGDDLADGAEWTRVET